MQNQSTGLMPKQKLKGFGYYTTGSGSATITFPSSFGNGSNSNRNRTKGDYSSLENALDSGF